MMTPEQFALAVRRAIARNELADAHAAELGQVGTLGVHVDIRLLRQTQEAELKAHDDETIRQLSGSMYAWDDSGRQTLPKNENA